MRGFKSQFIAAAGLVFALLYLAVASGCSRFRKPTDTTVVMQIQRLNELATVRYMVSRVVGIREPKVPIGEESILLVVEGRVTAGVDLSHLSPNDVRWTDRDTALVSLPPARIQDVALDESKTRVWDRQITWWSPWVPFSPDLEHRARMQAVEDIRKAAIEMHIEEQADRNAETAIRNLLNAFGITAEFHRAS